MGPRSDGGRAFGSFEVKFLWRGAPRLALIIHRGVCVGRSPGDSGLVLEVEYIKVQLLHFVEVFCPSDATEAMPMNHRPCHRVD